MALTAHFRSQRAQPTNTNVVTNTNAPFPTETNVETALLGGFNSRLLPTFTNGGAVPPQTIILSLTVFPQLQSPSSEATITISDSQLLTQTAAITMSLNSDPILESSVLFPSTTHSGVEASGGVGVSGKGLANPTQSLPPATSGSAFVTATPPFSTLNGTASSQIPGASASEASSTSPVIITVIAICVAIFLIVVATLLYVARIRKTRGAKASYASLPDGTLAVSQTRNFPATESTPILPTVAAAFTAAKPKIKRIGVKPDEQISLASSWNIDPPAASTAQNWILHPKASGIGGGSSGANGSSSGRRQSSPVVIERVVRHRYLDHPAGLREQWVAAEDVPLHELEAFQNGVKNAGGGGKSTVIDKSGSTGESSGKSVAGVVRGEGVVTLSWSVGEHFEMEGSQAVLQGESSGSGGSVRSDEALLVPIFTLIRYSWWPPEKAILGF
ncbi:hypothetical protein BC830DRAFT_1082670 [Chytriomyces sp. MP71]|nr:hypothetical protein BC830DRAFT_1082670 [Chytriomyces sp. MP71]